MKKNIYIILSVLTLGIIVPLVLNAQYIPQGGDAKKDTTSLLCEKSAESQLEMNNCAKNIMNVSEKKLNTTYQKVLKENAGDKIVLSSIKNAERKWVAYREAHCMVVAGTQMSDGGYMGGSMAPMQYSYCMSRLATDRIKELLSDGYTFNQ